LPAFFSGCVGRVRCKGAFPAKERNVRPAVTIRMDTACLETYKALGRGYAGIMAEVLAYAAAHPDMLANFSGMSRP